MLIVVGLLLFVGAFAAIVVAIMKAARRKQSRSALIAAAALATASLTALGASSGVEGALMVLALIAFAAGAATLVAALVQRLRRRDHARLARAGVAGLVLSLVLFAASLAFGSSVSLSMTLACLACGCVVPVLLVALIVQKIRKKPARRLLVALPAALAACVALGWGSSAVADIERARAAELYEIHRIENLQTSLDFAVEDGDEPLEVEEYATNTSGSVWVYDSEHLGLLLGQTEPATAETCKQEIQQSERIPEKFKNFFCNFVDRIEERYPTADLTVLQHNLVTLSVTELNTTEYLMKSMSADSLGCYVPSENAIYIPEGTVYVEGEFGFQVIAHEFCHAARGCRLNGNGRTSADFSVRAEDTLLEECMNTMFSCGLLNEGADDYAYRTASNYLSVMLDCMDNYELADYMNHGSTYFLSKLDEASGYTNYADVIWKLISLQRNDWQSDDINIASEEYDPIIDFVCELYFNKRLSPDCTDEEARAAASDLAARLFNGSPDDYPVNRDRVSEYLDIWRAAHASGEGA